MFAYSLNNPVSMCDHSGNFAIFILKSIISAGINVILKYVGKVAIGAAIGGTSALFTELIMGGDKIGSAAIKGAIVGGLTMIPDIAPYVIAFDFYHTMFVVGKEAQFLEVGILSAFLQLTASMISIPEINSKVIQYFGEVVIGFGKDLVVSTIDMMTTDAYQQSWEDKNQHSSAIAASHTNIIGGRHNYNQNMVLSNRV